jgi:hypothetical protein
VELIGPTLVACVMLVVAGVMKAVRPDDTARALVTMVPARARSFIGVRQLRVMIRSAAVLEAGVGLVAMLAPRTASVAAVAGSYLVFSAVVVSLRRRGGALASCGCFGTPDTPATLWHAGIDLLLALASGTVASAAPSSGSIVTVLARQPLHGVPLVAAAGVGAWLLYLSLSVLPALGAVRSTLASGSE